MPSLRAQSRKHSEQWKLDSLLIVVLTNLALLPVSTALNFGGLFGTGVKPLQHIGDFVPIDPRSVPTFLILGTAKGGTTDLYQQLVDSSVNTDPERPEIPVRSSLKEVAFLHHIELASANFTPYASAFHTYLTLINHPCASEPVPVMRNCLSNPRYFTIDATPVYYYSPNTPLLLRGFSPDSKVIMLLRDPMDRLEALYHHWTVQDGMWPSTSLEELTTAFFRYLRGQTELMAILHRLSKCTTRRCQADGWRDVSAQGVLRPHDVKIFLGGLYRYALAAWRLHYFQPNRVMLIDAHTYFRDRPGVMQQVVAFLYGRAMTSNERAFAKDAVPRNMKHRHNTTWAPGSTPKWMLSPSTHAELQQFYDLHVMKGLRAMVAEMRDEGAWVVGFGGEPWPWAK